MFNLLEAMPTWTDSAAGFITMVQYVFNAVVKLMQEVVFGNWFLTGMIAIPFIIGAVISIIHILRRS